MSKTPTGEEEWSSDVSTGVGDIMGRGGKLALLAIGVFAAWAALMPLSSAVVAPATLVAKGENKVLQHRTGGVVREILAIEGDLVKAGESIAVLSPEVDRAQLSRLKAQYSRAMAQKARLDAEKRLSGEYREPEPTVLRGGMSPGIDGDAVTSSFELESDAPLVDPAIGDEQFREFRKGRAAMSAEIQALTERAQAMAVQQRGLADRQSRIQGQVRLLSTQRAALAELVAADHISKQQLWDMEARLLERQGEMDQVRSQHDALSNSIAETEAQIAQARAVDERKTSEAMTQVLTEIAELGDQMRAAETGLADTIVRAPVTGTLVHSRLTTIGGVIPPGETFGQIVPEDAQLLVQGRVGQHDIAEVHVGLKAKVMLTALNARIYDHLPAKVTYVAADATTDQRTGEQYFEVRAELESVPEELKTVLTPGMGGQVQITGPSRTFLGYLMRPIDDSFSRAFKEQR